MSPSPFTSISRSMVLIVSEQELLVMRSYQGYPVKKVQCTVAPLVQRFYATQFLACLGFIRENEPAGNCRSASELPLALTA